MRLPAWSVLISRIPWAKARWPLVWCLTKKGR
ncbi:Uncharacterised protein [Vibrio cholerae]|nr:Uncharacterised protein [Vibrio cholerae]